MTEFEPGDVVAITVGHLWYSAGVGMVNGASVASTTGAPYVSVNIVGSEQPEPIPTRHLKLIASFDEVAKLAGWDYEF